MATKKTLKKSAPKARPYVLVLSTLGEIEGDHPDRVRTYATLEAARKVAKREFLDRNCGDDPSPVELQECGYVDPDCFDDGYTRWAIHGPGL